MPRCNGCGRDRETSREHLIHFGVGRALLGDPSVSNTEEMRRRLEHKTFLQAAKDAGSPNGRGRLIRADMHITSLLCETCNSGWARELEEEAGDHLFNFLNGDAPMDRGLLGRWIRFFAIKCGAYYQRTEWLAAGDRPLLQDLSKPEHPDEPLFMAEMVDRPSVTWAYYQRNMTDMWRGAMIVTQSVIWFLPPSLEAARVDQDWPGSRSISSMGT
jgi:hypothetical protein